ncbi:MULTISPECIES: hypothetical protein [Mycobacterium ulcerans group]|nr:MULTISPECIES: hypothetical protein [Mycobacterium ulcerans group]
MDPKLLAVAFGVDPEAAMIYLADRIDNVRTAHLADDTFGR